MLHWAGCSAPGGHWSGWYFDAHRLCAICHIRHCRHRQFRYGTPASCIT
jgi:hypothetical protein